MSTSTKDEIKGTAATGLYRFNSGLYLPCGTAPERHSPCG